MKKFIAIILMLIFAVSFSNVFAQEIFDKDRSYTLSYVSSKNYSDLSSSNRNNEDNSLANTLEKLLLNRNVHRILLTIAMMAIVFEIFSPGFGLGGLISIISIFLFFLGTFSAGSASISSFVMFMVGIILIFIELLVPGFGLPGISGMILLALGLINSMGDFTFALVSLAIALIISLILGFILFKLGYNLKILDKFLLKKESSSEQGYLSVDSPCVKVGDILLTIRPLRPVGKARLINNKEDERCKGEFEVISSNSYIDKDKKVVIIKISGSKIFVEKNWLKECIWLIFFKLVL